MIVVNSTVAMGDCLQTFGLMRDICAQRPGTAIYWTRSDIAELFDSERYGAVRIDDLPSGSHEVHNFCFHDYMLGRIPNGGAHPAVEFASRLGITLDPTPVDLIYGFGAPRFDVVLTPYVLNNPEKNPPPAFWQELVVRLRERGLTVAVVGKTALPSSHDLEKIQAGLSQRTGDPAFLVANTTHYLEGVTYYTNQPLPMVATAMRGALMFICPDTGLMHLNLMIGNPGIHLYYDKQTIVTTDGGRYELGRPLTVDDVLARFDERGSCQVF